MVVDTFTCTTSAGVTTYLAGSCGSKSDLCKPIMSSTTDKITYLIHITLSPVTSAAINSGEGPWTGVDPSTYCEDVSFSDGICTGGLFVSVFREPPSAAKHLYILPDTQTGNACNTPWVSPAPAPSPRAVSLIPGWSSETAPLVCLHHTTHIYVLLTLFNTPCRGPVLSQTTPDALLPS